jgi:hypothetical protein
MYEVRRGARATRVTIDRPGRLSLSTFKLHHKLVGNVLGSLLVRSIRAREVSKAYPDLEKCIVEQHAQSRQQSRGEATPIEAAAREQYGRLVQKVIGVWALTSSLRHYQILTSSLPCIFHQQFPMYSTQGGVIMSATPTPIKVPIFKDLKYNEIEELLTVGGFCPPTRRCITAASPSMRFVRVTTLPLRTLPWGSGRRRAAL